ncbi:ORF56 [Alphabaculovirus altermyunipunctae]|jgi:hypothetical protein|uniref:ORF56 n=1 Tax=Mythimna unipuncta nucleopolyhedrovirus TaxID=447897 RepID=A0A346TPJ3_9ABAC|nr:ORF56 [Mythimna unipuncta nucleopolyhedrovirus]AXU41503.1 ORF56 [Mythimna unipuncta nucleopolyhedrovirus]
MHSCKSVVIWLLLILFFLTIFMIDFLSRRKNLECHPDTNLGPDHKSCTAYYNCYSGRRRLCPDHQCYDEALGMCTKECDECYSRLCAKAGFGNTAIENSCERFLLCAGSAVIPLSCASRFCYSDSLRTCVKNNKNLCRCLNRA